MATITQIPRLVRANLAAGAKGGHIPHGNIGGGKGSEKAPSSKSGGGSSGGGGAAKSGGAFADGYDASSETLPGYQLGPFILSEPKPSTRALESQKKNAERGEQLNQMLAPLQEAIASGKPMDQALRDVMRTNPNVIHTMMQAGLFKDLGGLQKVLGGGAGARKGSEFQTDLINGNTIDKLNSTFRPIVNQDTGKPMGPATLGSVSTVELPNGEQGYIRTPGSRSQAAPGVTLPNQSSTNLNPEVQRSVIGAHDAAANKANNPTVGKPGLVSQEDRRLFSVAGNAYELLSHLSEYAQYTGPFTGWLKEKGGEYFGTSNPGEALAIIHDRMEQAAQTGLLDSKFPGMVKQFESTLPGATKGSDFNTGLINGMKDDMRHRLQSRADSAEAQLNRYGQVTGPDGKPIGLDPSTQHELSRADVYPQSSKDRASETWKLRNAPDTLTRKGAETIEQSTIRDPQGNFVSSADPHMLPQDDMTLGRIVDDRVRASKQRQAQPIPNAPAAPVPPAPGGPDAMAPQPPQTPAPQPTSMPLPPTPYTPQQVSAGAGAATSEEEEE